MKKLLKELNRVKNKYKNIKSNTSLNKRIKGRLEFKKHNEKIYYYRVVKDELQNKYIKKYIKVKDIELVRKLAQKTYDEDVYKLSDNFLESINRFINDCKKYNIEKYHKKLNPNRRKIIEPVMLSKDEKLKIWKDRKYIPKQNYFNNIEIYTNKKERVRSKTEKILADLFYKKGIEYKYECPLNLSNNVTIYPDFTFLDTENNIEIYWEHFGMMDNSEYVSKVMTKIELYQKNNIRLGKNLIITLESSKKSLNYEIVEDLISEYLIK